MAALGKLVVSVSANIAQFTSAMDKAAYIARSRMDMVTGAIKNVRTIIATSFAAIAAGTAVAFKNMVQNADDLVKSAQKVGVSVEELQKIRYAGELANLSTEEVTKAMVKLAKTAADGNPAFSAMGVSIKDATGNIKPMGQLLAEIADKFAGYKDGAEKTALAVEIFGKSGAEIIPLLNGGSSALAQAAKEADQFGFVMSGNAAKSAERLNDNMTRLSRVWDGVLNQLLSGLIPSIEKFSDALIAMSTNSNIAQNAVTVFGAALKIISPIAIGLSGTLDVLLAMLSGIGGAFKSIGTGDFSGAIDAINKATDDILFASRRTRQAFASIWDDANKKSEDVSKQIESGGGVNAPIVAVEKGNQKLKQLAEQRASLLRNQFEEIVRLVSGEEELARVQAERLRMNDSEMAQFEKNLAIIKELKIAEEERQQVEAKASQIYAEIGRVIENNMTPLEQYQMQLEKLNDLLAGGLSADQYVKAVTKLQDAFDEATQSSRDTLFSGLLTEEEEIKQSYERRKAAILEATTITEDERSELMRRLQTKTNDELLAISDDFWTRWMLSAEKSFSNFDKLTADVIMATSSKFGSMFESIIFDSESASQAFRNFAESMLRSIVNALGQMIAQWVAYKSVQAAVGGGAASAAATAKAAEAQAASQMAALNAFSSTAAIPLVGPAMAPGAAAAALAATQPMAATVAALAASAAASSFAGAFDAGGMIPAGRWGIVGERGPEIVQGPAMVTSRTDTADALQRPMNIRIVNAFDTSIIGDYLGSDAGEKVIMNAVKRNQTTIRSLVAT